MHRTPPKKIPPDPTPSTTENIQPLGWSSQLSQSSHEGSLNNTMVEVGAYVTIQDETENEFQEVLSRNSKKRKKISPIKNNTPSHNPTFPSQNLGIYLKITPDTPFEIKKVALLRVAIFKMLKSMFSLNINRDGSLLIALQDSKSADILQNSKSLLNIPIKSVLWSPNQNPTKIVVYNIPPEIPIQDLKEGLSDRTGNPIPVADVTQLGKPDANGQKLSKSFLFTLREENNNLDQIFLFGQRKPHKPYKPKPIQCQKCLRLGHTKNTCSETLHECNSCKNSHPTGMINCKNNQPKCINCNGPHDSTNKTLCPVYKKRALTLQIATEKNIPYPFAAMEANAAQSHLTKNFMKPPNPLTHRPTILPKASSTPNKTPSSKQPSSHSYKRGSPWTNLPASTSNDRISEWPPLPSRNESEVLTGINQIINKKPDEYPNELTPNMCLFILNSNAVQSMNLKQPQKAKIISELAKLYLPNHMQCGHPWLPFL